jgi:hypothetical protein
MPRLPLRRTGNTGEDVDTEHPGYSKTQRPWCSHKSPSPEHRLRAKKRWCLSPPPGVWLGYGAAWAFIVSNPAARLTVLANRVGEPTTGPDFSDARGGAGKVSEAQVEGGSVSRFGILRRGNTGPFHGSCMALALTTPLEIEFRACAGVYCCSGEN